MISSSLKDPSYIFENGYRRVVPYYYTFEAFAKGRWIGKPLFQVFMNEFGGRSASYYKLAIESGKIKVNGERKDLDYSIQSKDVLTHAIHRHEPPVLDLPIEIVYESQDMLVVSKPPSLPVHPTGRYTYNCLSSILKYEYSKPNLHPVNRIDRLTSGLVLFAKNKASAQVKMNEMVSRTISKMYLARVRGDFPYDEIKVDVPLAIFAHKLGINHVNFEIGKECVTVFKKRPNSFDGTTSLVECFPLTGRTHQIRVHLQYLGYPIHNDPLYASFEIWGPDGGKGTQSQEELKRITTALALKLNDEDPGYIEDQLENQVECLDCSHPRDDPPLDNLLIWLHSIKYNGEDWSYQTNEPFWAVQ